MKQLLTVFSLLLVLSACRNSRPELLTVEGSFTGEAGKKIMLAELPFTSPKRLVLDSATLDSTGKFKLTTIQQPEGMYQLFISGGPGILLINDTTDIVVNANADSLGAYEVKNSEGSKSIRNLYKGLTKLQEQAARSNAIADSIAKLKMPDSLKMPYLQAADRSSQAVEDYLTAYLNQEKNGTALWYGLGVASRFISKEQWGIALEKAVVNHRNHPGLNLLKANLAVAQQQAGAGQQLLNKPVANITLPDTSGRAVSVGNFKGKWLLMDFWASWCAPCRAENPNLVATYRHYRDKNFAVLGISLDKDKDAWTKAIAKDSLKWTQVSDLKDWDSKAVFTYGINAIPFNMLVDTAGKVVAVNLHGAALDKKLSELLVK